MVFLHRSFDVYNSSFLIGDSITLMSVVLAEDSDIVKGHTRAYHHVGQSLASYE